LSFFSGFIVLFPSLITIPLVIKFLKSKPEEKIRNLAKKILVLVLFAPAFYLLINMGINHSKFEFTKEKWLSQNENRIYLVDDMMHEFNLVGKSKTEVINFLGEPTDTEYFKTPDNVVYYLGPERGPFSIDSEWLVIIFDKNNKVTKYKVTTD
jgi:outer membrane protein assembly factor BamE (lipoprotein component of BamABCDE complex)